MHVKCVYVPTYICNTCLCVVHLTLGHTHLIKIVLPTFWGSTKDVSSGVCALYWQHFTHPHREKIFTHTHNLAGIAYQQAPRVTYSPTHLPIVWNKQSTSPMQGKQAAASYKYIHIHIYDWGKVWVSRATLLLLPYIFFFLLRSVLCTHILPVFTFFFFWWAKVQILFTFF